jgi:hypothetical protein
MKEALQQQTEDGDEVTVDAAGKPVVSSEAMQRKLARNRARSERVSLLLLVGWGVSLLNVENARETV